MDNTRREKMQSWVLKKWWKRCRCSNTFGTVHPSVYPFLFNFRRKKKNMYRLVRGHWLESAECSPAMRDLCVSASPLSFFMHFCLPLYGTRPPRWRFCLALGPVHSPPSACACVSQQDWIYLGAPSIFITAMRFAIPCVIGADREIMGVERFRDCRISHAASRSEYEYSF